MFEVKSSSTGCLGLTKSLLWLRVGGIPNRQLPEPNTFSRQTHACAAHNGRGFAMPQICAFDDYVNFRLKTEADSA